MEHGRLPLLKRSKVYLETGRPPVLGKENATQQANCERRSFPGSGVVFFLAFIFFPGTIHSMLQSMILESEAGTANTLWVLRLEKTKEKKMKLRRTIILCMPLVLVLIVGNFPLSAEGQGESTAVGTGTTEPSGDIVIFHAGSLSVPFEVMEKEFEQMHPSVDILREAAGSQACARKITDVGKPCDIMASADYKVIDKLLIPDYADWNIRFATNQLVLCYTDSSAHAARVNAENWYKILQESGVVWGHSDPNLDPCGYRALMVMQLAELHYGIPGLYDSLLANRPEANVRPKSVDLISLLQTGNMDYAWEYLSVAVQHGLEYVPLPDEINLGNYEYDDFYSKAVVEVTGKEPGTTMDMIGQSVTYGITLVKTAPNRSSAEDFLVYLLNPDGGLAVLKSQGQPPFVPARVSSQAVLDAVPGQLQSLLEVRN
jgi:molybdate/tungstate transport system substrate-binding protein